ncbi:preprotein translocase subunit SecG [Aeoliella sp. ICT_H6.2]|uniref:Protein-export membrane protein SecG n=1 Tax=Aeoliella straminimaris TaxID=2954799 RepID=A0A9X2F6V4_9BACT|nr:preprotein translocase subunit SecG [Aeoliella straminimaris]MCO6043370.1 preprotein translocase subunit SecG [Aeoliella straminimaris]
MEALFQVALFLIALFMILLILVQRGRGGGLAGALGGPGGSSAFGAKAGDAFTKITAYTALIWMFVCIVATLYFANGRGGAGSSKLGGLDEKRSVQTETEGTGTGAAEESSSEAGDSSSATTEESSSSDSSSSEE